MTKLKLGLAAGAAAILAFGVAACGQTTTTPEEAPPAAEETTDMPAEPAADAVDAAGEAAGTEEAPADAPPTE